VIDSGLGRSMEEARANNKLGKAMIDALIEVVQAGGGPMHTITFDAPGSGGRQTWTDAGVSTCPECKRARICFRSPFEPGLVAHFCLTSWDLEIERNGHRIASTSRRLVKFLNDLPPGSTVTSMTIGDTTIPFDPPIVTPLRKPS